MRGRKLIDLIGKKFGRLTPIKYMGKNKNSKHMWLCKCDCGNEKIVLGGNLREGKTNSCGCFAIVKTIERNKNRFIDLTGQKFDRLTVTKCVNRYKLGNSLWECLCDCGETTIVKDYHLKSGTIRSCRCLSKELTAKRSFKHGHNKPGKRSKTYKAWDSMKQRCANPNMSNYKDYGGRGITICERWLDKDNGFQNFLEDMGECPPGLSLDRKDNNKLIDGYSPNNCRWATPKQQANNRRSNLDKKSLLIRQYGRKLIDSLSEMISKDKNKIGFSKYLPYNSKQLQDHLESIRISQNNCCPMCNKSYNKIKYDVDHIIPTSTAKTKEELLKLFNLDNLSLLCYRCNRYIKRAKPIELVV